MAEFSMTEVVTVLRGRGVAAFVEMTGGNTGTIYAGPTYEEPDYGTRYAAVAGPGNFSTGMADTEEFCVGPDDSGEAEPTWVPEDATVAQVADLIAAQVDAHNTARV